MTTTKEPVALPVIIGGRLFFKGLDAKKEIDPDGVSVDVLNELKEKRTFILENFDHVHNQNLKQVLEILKEINDKIEEVDLVLERIRVKDVLRKEEEILPPVEIKECPICLEGNINLNDDYGDSVTKFTCGGKFMCGECNIRSMGKLNVCPLCRSKLPETNEEAFSNVHTLALKGVGWAMYQLGVMHLHGQNGQTINKHAAVQWFTRAVEEAEYAPAMSVLAHLYQQGANGVLEKDATRALTLFRKSASKHNSAARLGLGSHYFSRNDNAEAIKCFTIAIANDPEFKRDALSEAQFSLGTLFLKKYGCGSLNQSLDRAIFYLRKALASANAIGAPDNEKKAQLLLGQAIYKRCLERYGGRYFPGHNAIPQTLYWLRRSLVSDNKEDNHALSCIDLIVKSVKSFCNRCGKSKNKLLSEKGICLKNCVRCKAIWYCSKECQLKDWKAGHKKDCWKTWEDGENEKVLR